MPNRLHQFPNNVPPPKLQIWWCYETRSWQIWFGDDAPMFEDGEYTPFKGKLYDYTRGDSK